MLAEEDGDAAEEERFVERASRRRVTGGHRAERRLFHVLVEELELLRSVDRVRNVVEQDPGARVARERDERFKLFAEFGSERETVERVGRRETPRVTSGGSVVQPSEFSRVSFDPPTVSQWIQTLTGRGARC